MLKYKLGDWVIYKGIDYGGTFVGQIVGVDTSPFTSNYLVYNKQLRRSEVQIYNTLEDIKSGFPSSVRNRTMTFKEDADFSKTTWIDKETILKKAEVPDSKLARNLYKNQITGEETRNGQTFLILGGKNGK